MATFTKGPCSLGEKCVAPHADLRPIYKCKKCEAQLHSVVYCSGIPASEGGVPDAQGDSVVCHGCASMVKCASNNCVIKKSKVATAVFCCLHDDCKKPVHPSCAKALLEKMEHDICTDDGTVLYFCGPRHGASYFKARQPIDQSKNKLIRKAWTGDPGFQVLINWWTTEGNWDAYCGGKGAYGCTKVSYCSELAQLINNTPGASKRTGEDVRKKIDDILVRFNKAIDFLNATGQGILNNNPGCHEQKELEIKG